MAWNPSEPSPALLTRAKVSKDIVDTPKRGSKRKRNSFREATPKPRTEYSQTLEDLLLTLPSCVLRPS